MFIKPIDVVTGYLQQRARDFGYGCEKVYVSLSGGVDSAVVVTILCREFGPENVVALFRDIRSNPKHKKDVEDLQKSLGFYLIDLDANPLYDLFLAQCKKQFKAIGFDWYEEGVEKARKEGWDGAFASLKSRFTTPFATFIAKVIDKGNGRIYGTGNAEEDLLFRYFDKFGDGAVDNNILVGLTKMEVRQIALWFAKEYDADVFARIARKTPSADLNANGDAHNDEDELTSWAYQAGFKIRLSYGSLEKEGNIAWITRQDWDFGVVTGDRASWSEDQLKSVLGYSEDQVQLTLFARMMEGKTKHKDLGIPGVDRWELREKCLVD